MQELEKKRENLKEYCVK